MLRVDLIHVIRHKVLVEGKSRRQVAADLGVSRNTVRKYIEAADAQPQRVESKPRPRPVRDRAAARTEEILEEWSTKTGGKQQPTGSRIHQKLIEDGVEVGVTVVREILAERRRCRAEAAIPLSWRPGEVAQVDFFEVLVDVNGQRQKAWKFLMRLMFSGRDLVWLYERCDQLSLLDAHVRAFAHFGGVPQRIVYDNMRAAVLRFLRRGRQLNPRFHAMVSHYLFEPCFARPYRGDDKGGVESRGGSIRRQHLTPIPQGDSLNGIAVQLLETIDTEASHKARQSGQTVMECFDREKGSMHPLPAFPFKVERVAPVSVSSSALVRLEGATYSVPCTWKSLEATAYIGVGTVRIVCRSDEIVLPRVQPGVRYVKQRHYLPEFARKPQAIRQNAPELLAELGPPFDRLWRLLVDAHGPRDAARLMAGVIKAIVEHGEEPVAAALVDSLAEGRLDLLRLAQLQPPPAHNPVPPRFAGIEVQAARAADFDHLLKGGQR